MFIPIIVSQRNKICNKSENIKNRVVVVENGLFCFNFIYRWKERTHRKGGGTGKSILIVIRHYGYAYLVAEYFPKHNGAIHFTKRLQLLRFIHICENLGERENVYV